MPRINNSNFDEIMADSLPQTRAEMLGELGRRIESRHEAFKNQAAVQADQVIAQLRNMLANARVRIAELEQENLKLQGASNAKAAYAR